MQIQPHPYSLGNSDIEASARNLADKLNKQKFKSVDISLMFCADHMYKGRSFQGELAKYTLPVMFEAVSILAERHPESKNFANLKYALEFAVLLSKDRGNYKKHFERLSTLKADEFIAFDSVFGRHVFMFEIERNVNDRFNFRLYDGTNMEYHHSQTILDIEHQMATFSIQHAVEFLDLSTEQLNIGMLERLKDGYFRRLEIYKNILPNFKQEYAGPSGNQRFWGSGQNGNCCSVFSPMLLAKSKLNKAEYQELKLVLRMALYPYYACSQIPNDKTAHLINCIEAVKKISKGYQKLGLPLDAKIASERSILEKQLVFHTNENPSIDIEENFSAIFRCLEDYNLEGAKRHLESIFEKISKNGEVILGDQELKVILRFKDKIKKFANSVMNGVDPSYHFLYQSFDLLFGIKVLINYSITSNNLNKELEHSHRKLKRYFEKEIPIESKGLRIRLFHSRENLTAWRRIFLASDIFKKGVQINKEKSEKKLEKYRRLFRSK